MPFVEMKRSSYIDLKNHVKSGNDSLELDEDTLAEAEKLFVLVMAILNMPWAAYLFLVSFSAWKNVKEEGY